MRPNPKKTKTIEVSIEISKGGTHLKIVTTSEKEMPQSKSEKNAAPANIRAFELRDVMSARIDENDPRVMHIWSFKQHAVKKGCCCKTTTHPRVLEV
jgi:hypothetical protein